MLCAGSLKFSRLYRFLFKNKYIPIKQIGAPLIWSSPRSQNFFKKKRGGGLRISDYRLRIEKNFDQIKKKLNEDELKIYQDHADSSFIKFIVRELLHNGFDFFILEVFVVFSKCHFGFFLLLKDFC